MHRRTFLSHSVAALGLSTLVSAKDAALQTKVTAALDQGLGYLEKAQKPDGCWSSADYPGLTGLAVQAFLLAPDAKYHGAAPVKNGLKFIRASAKPDGGIYTRGLGNYNTSLALACLLRAGESGDAALIEAARKYLVHGQTSAGGFGYEAGGGRMGRPDLDNTVFALEALELQRKAGRAQERPGQQELDWKAAIDFVTRCQSEKADPAEKGGFQYTPGADEKEAHSYGTMTYAGLLSLTYAEVPKDDARIKAAVSWLARRYTLEENPGQGQEGLYYYYFVMAKGLTAAGIDTLRKEDGTSVDWRPALAAKLLSLQKPDGSWSNNAGRWMEKDPVLATSYVAIALGLLRDRL